MFLGANIDTVEEVNRFGIKANRVVDYHSDRDGTEVNYKALSKAISVVREYDACYVEATLEGLDEKIRADYSRRKE